MNGATVFVKDVGQVHDGWLVQQNVVRKDGQRSVLLSIIKNGNASTLEVVNAVRNALDSDPRRGAGRHAHRRTVRPVGVRQAGDRRRAARGRDRGRPDRADDPAVPGLVALDPGRHDVDSARDPDLAGRAVFPGRDDQHHDPGRPRARRRHPGRQFDGDDREHPSPAERGRPAAAAGHAAWRRRHRRADPGLDARHQLRVHLGDLPRRAGQVPVHAAGPCRGVRHAGVLRPVAHPDADHDRPPDQGRASRWRRCRRPARLVRPLPSCLRRAASSACAQATSGC